MNMSCHKACTEVGELRVLMWERRRVDNLDRTANKEERGVLGNRECWVRTGDLNTSTKFGDTFIVLRDNGA